MPRGTTAARRIGEYLGGVDDPALHAALEAALKAPKARALVAGVLAHSPFLTAIAVDDPAHLAPASPKRPRPVSRG